MDNGNSTGGLPRPPELTDKNYKVWSGIVRAHLAIRTINPDQLLPPPYLSAEHARADQIDLVEAGQQASDAQIIMAIMRGLPSDYDVECAILRSLSAYTSLTYSVVVSRLQEKELDPRRTDLVVSAAAPHTNGTSGASVAALFAKQKRGGGGNGNGRGGSGREANTHHHHHADSDDEDNVCKFCFKPGHWERACKKKKEMVAQLKAQATGGPVCL